MKTIATLILIFSAGVATWAQNSNAKPGIPVADSASCLAAIQVIGHNGEQLIQNWNLVGETGQDLDATLSLATGAGLYLDIARKVLASDQEMCDRVNKKMDRTYPSRLDEHDQMSTGRLMMVISQLRTMASAKAKLEAEASRDFSH